MRCGLFGRCRWAEWLTAGALGFLVASVPAQSAASALLYSFVSAPDTWNADVGDVRSASGWDAGEPNSINRSWRRATGTILARFASHSPRFVLVPGDLVNGHWYEDIDHVSTFGDVSGLSGKELAVREAAGLYYPQWRSQFRAHGLRVRPGLGDHSLGDNPWVHTGKRVLTPIFRDAWARAFTYRRARFVYAEHPPRGTQHAKTAYAFRSGPVVFVMIDVFHQDRDGTVAVKVVGSQLRWLRNVLRRANANPAVKFLVVEGHTPILRPARGIATSGLRVSGGSSSPLWRTLRANSVDLYLCGEFHAISVANRGGVEQVTHGSLLGFLGGFNYLGVEVYPEELRLTLYEARVTRAGRARLWQVGHTRPWASRIIGDFGVVGTMRVTADGLELDRTGYFAE